MDPGLAAVLLGIDAVAALYRGDVLGRMLDTFVLAQLRPLLSLDAPPARAYHLRQHDGRREIDVILEAADGRIVGLEIKATAAPTRDDARHLGWLRDQLGDRFVAGAVLNTGRWTFPLEERIAAVPIAALWGEPSQHQTSAGFRPDEAPASSPEADRTPAPFVSSPG